MAGYTYDRSQVEMANDWLNVTLLGYQKLTPIERKIYEVLQVVDEADIKQFHKHESVNSRNDTDADYERTYYRTCCDPAFHKPTRLYCRYANTHSPFLTIAPFKMEILSLDPYIVLYHDVLSQKQALSLREIAAPLLKRALTLNGTRADLVPNPGRTTHGAWLSPCSNSSLLAICRLMRDLSNFDLTGSEYTQIMNYGLAGHYGEHYDYFSERVLQATNIRNRIATLLIYLSDVELGGATVFPELKISVQPKRGNALLFHNLDNKGGGDERTSHTACPVLKGNKWLLSQWINDLAQLFIKPCHAQ